MSFKSDTESSDQNEDEELHRNMEKAYNKRVRKFGVIFKETPPQTDESESGESSDNVSEEEKKTVERILEGEKYLDEEYQYKKDKETLEAIEKRQI